MVSLYFLAGLLFANLGVIGLYLGRVFDEAQSRPIYVVRATTFEDANDPVVRGSADTLPDRDDP
jgi:dolichol-phosphate mannosyltransferase